MIRGSNESKQRVKWKDPQIKVPVLLFAARAHITGPVRNLARLVMAAAVLSIRFQRTEVTQLAVLALSAVLPLLSLAEATPPQS